MAIGSLIREAVEPHSWYVQRAVPAIRTSVINGEFLHNIGWYLYGIIGLESQGMVEI